MAASKNSHVPKFGNWDHDNENVPYTAFFENARKGKARVRMNPNDPEENPEAFIWGTPGLQSHGNSQSAQPPNHIEEQMGYYNPRGNDRNTSDHPRSRSRKSTATSDSSTSDKNNSSDHHRRLKSDRKKGRGDGSNSFSPALPGHYSGQRSGSYPSDEHHHRGASVPKFGAWDESDPKSGEGFTVIFNKVKEEKQIASTQFPIVPVSVPAQTNNYSDGQPKWNEGSWFRSKICCCCRLSRRRN